jgi:hypothetical protein
MVIEGTWLPRKVELFELLNAAIHIQMERGHHRLRETRHNRAISWCRTPWLLR